MSLINILREKHLPLGGLLEEREKDAHLDACRNSKEDSCCWGAPAEEPRLCCAVSDQKLPRERETSVTGHAWFLPNRCPLSCCLYPSLPLPPAPQMAHEALVGIPTSTPTCSLLSKSVCLDNCLETIQGEALVLLHLTLGSTLRGRRKSCRFSGSQSRFSLPTLSPTPQCLGKEGAQNIALGLARKSS